MKKFPWEMTQAEWLAAPRQWLSQPRRMTVDEWRRYNGYSNPLDDHGDFRHPHGISKAVRRRIDRRLQERLTSMTAGAVEYQRLLAAGRVPMVTEEHEIRADGFDTETQLARARLYHRRQVRHAMKEGQPVPAAVLADYGFDPIVVT